MLSVNTNSGAMTALQYLDNTNAQYQYRLSLAALNFQTGNTP